MNKELISILEVIEREKGINKEILFKALESALVSAARKIIGKKIEDVSVTVDRETGAINMFSEGQKIDSEQFSRISAQTAKQVIMQKLREAEREVIYDDYQQKIGTVLTGLVHRFERRDIVIDLGKAEAILPYSQQIQRERYRQGDRIRAYIINVNKTTKGPEIVLSRTHEGLVRKLFELEVPEIIENVVEIKGIAREAGYRTKIAVFSKDEKIDPVGACVGMRGTRIKDVVRELHGEKIDVIRWNSDIKQYVKAAILPAEVENVSIDKETKRITLSVKDDQLSLAIGKHGQNVRLASKLLEWEIDIKTSGEAKVKQEKPEIQGAIISISEIEGVGKQTQKVLTEAGYDDAVKLASANVSDLIKLEKIGEKTAEKIIAAAKKALDTSKDAKE